MNSRQLVEQSTGTAVCERIGALINAVRQLKASMDNTIRDAIELGRLLSVAKSEVKFAQWQTTLKAIGVNDRSASRYMLYYANAELLISTKGIQSFSAADKLISSNRPRMADVTTDLTEIPGKLSEPELDEWQKQLAVIDSCREERWVLIEAIGVIRDRKLYREEYDSFEEFVTHKLSDFGFGGLRHVNKLIVASKGRYKLASNIQESDVQKFDKTSGLAVFADVPDGKIAEVASKSIEIAGGDKPTVKQIKLAKGSVTVEPPSRLVSKPSLADQLRAILVQMPERDAMQVVSEVYRVRA